MMFKFIDGVYFYKTPYEGYLVSKCGKIVSFRKPASKSLVRVDYDKKPKFLSYKTDRDGYFEVTLSIDCKRYCKKVHQVVAETFLTKSNIDFVVDHINSDRKDNRVSNLRYISASENSSIGRSGHIPSVSKVTSVLLGGKIKVFPCIKHALDYFCVESSYYYRFRTDTRSMSKKSLYKILDVVEGQETIEIILTER